MASPHGASNSRWCSCTITLSLSYILWWLSNREQGSWGSVVDPFWCCSCFHVSLLLGRNSFARILSSVYVCYVLEYFCMHDSLKKIYASVILFLIWVWKCQWECIISILQVDCRCECSSICFTCGVYLSGSSCLYLFLCWCFCIQRQEQPWWRTLHFSTEQALGLSIPRVHAYRSHWFQGSACDLGEVLL